MDHSLPPSARRACVSSVGRDPAAPRDGVSRDSRKGRVSAAPSGDRSRRASRIREVADGQSPSSGGDVASAGGGNCRLGPRVVVRVAGNWRLAAAIAAAGWIAWMAAPPELVAQGNVGGNAAAPGNAASVVAGPRPSGGPGGVGAYRVEPVKKDASDPFFEEGRIPRLRIEINPQQLQRLREDARRYAEATVVEEGGATLGRVALKLKGAAGSFRDINDRPALTLNTDKFVPGQRFHDLEKFHLNNSVQDASYLNEWICWKLCQQAGMPAPRVTHARVWLNNRDLGLYVLKEGFDKRFLKRHFADTHGNLYDGGFLMDIDANLEKDLGDGPDDHSDVKTLAAACREPQPEARWRLIAERLDVEAYLNFMALERLGCHWDGYSCNRNNYRLYFDPKTKRSYFLPHGMDQMFGDPNFSLFDNNGPIVSNAVLGNPQWRAAYRKRIVALQPLYAPEKLIALADQAAGRLKPVLEAIDRGQAAAHANQVRELRDRLTARSRAIAEQLLRAEPLPLEFNAQGRVELATGWAPAQESTDAKLSVVERDGRPVELVVEAGPSGRCVASWRQRVLLAQGNYRFEARIVANKLDPLVEAQGTGAGLRISGGMRDNKVVGDEPPRVVGYDFQVTEPQRIVELVAEVRAKSGVARFQAPMVLSIRP
jgi:spore coat protein H